MASLSSSNRAGDHDAIEVLSPEDVLGIGLGPDILIVDDHESNLVAYEAALAPLGRTLVTVRSGIDALAKLLAQDFALILLDVTMPGMSGLETARLIRERPRCKGIPIIFITGMSASPEIILEAYDVGAFDFVVKPIPPEVLRAKARVYLQLQERTQQLLHHAAKLRDTHERLAETEDRIRERDASLSVARAAESESRRKDEFLAMLGHELRNPLATMSSALDIIKFREGTLGRELSILDRQVGHLTHVVGDLVDVSRITQGTISLRREAVDLATALALATDTARPHIELHQHQLVTAVPGDLLVDADLHRLTQVLANLLTNAAKYTPPSGRIEVSAIVDAAQVEIVVRDNGRGIPATLLPHVFDIFVQGERTPGRREGGLGIGLTLVRSVVELHGGSVTAHSDGPGTGATFTVRWPKASNATPTMASQPLVRPREATTPRVLIVDANADAAELLAEVVRSLGHEVMIAHDGAAALEIAGDYRPTIAVIDIGLVVGDGYEVARRLGQLPSCADTMLIALTGHDQPEERARSKAAGFAHHLVKPVEIRTLRSLLVAPAIEKP